MSLPLQSNTRDAVLAFLLEHGEAEASNLARTQCISVQAMRRQLRSLAEAGLVESSLCSSGPGRPSNRWRLTDLGRRRFPDSSDRFALGLLESMRASLPEETVHELLNRQTEPRQSAIGIILGRSHCPSGWNDWPSFAVKRDMPPIATLTTTGAAGDCRN